MTAASPLPFTVDVTVDGGSACKIQLSPIARPVGDRPPVDLVCVIDVSGSMGAEAMARDSEGNTESTGLSVLDVVKHAVLTVAELLNADDRLSIVTFSNSAQEVLALASMDTVTKETLKTTLEQLRPDGGTNLWSGLVCGMDVAKHATSTGTRNTSVFLLTDGQPTYHPPKGHVGALKDYIAGLPNVALSFSVSTFGFGDSLNSELLSEIAQTAHGSFGYIPDSGMVGTVFVNAAANLLATAATNVHATVSLPRGVEPTCLPYGATYHAATGEVAVEFGTVAFGQDRVAVIEFVKGCSPVAPQDIIVTVSARQGRDRAVGRPMTTDSQRASWHLHKMRQDVVRALFSFKQTTIEAAQSAAPTRSAWLEYLSSWSRIGAALSPSEKELAEALIFDLDGEVALGVSSSTNWTRWGQHYSYALGFANLLQQCTNFKDHSVQCYGSPFFKDLQTLGEKAFLGLPPPVPTRSVTYQTTSYSMAATTGAAPVAAALRSVSPPRDMGWAYNCSGGCVAPHCLVTVRAGARTSALKRACDVQRGDVMADGSTVACVVKVCVPNASMEFVELEGGLLVSPFHPVHVNGSWHFPAECPTRVGTKVLSTTHMYSYVLEASGAALAPCATIDGVSVVSFAHGCGPEVPIVGHAFFGTGAAKAALQRSSAYIELGEVEVRSFVRDVSTNRIVDIAIE